MSYFPAFIDLKDKRILVAGAGKIAQRKTEMLLKFQADITVCAPVIPDWVKKLGINYMETMVQNIQVCGYDMVVYAADDLQLAETISQKCQSEGVLINCVDQKELSTFIFGSMIQKGPLTIGISTSGASPSAARYLKKKIEDIIPENIEEILDWLDWIRPWVLQYVNSKERSAFFHDLFCICLQAGRGLNQSEWDNFLKEKKIG